MGARLRKAAHIVVGELEAARQRPPVPRLKSRLVRDHVVSGRPASGKDRISGRSRNRRAEGERAAPANGGDPQSDFFAGEIVQGADFVVWAPLAPVSRRVSQQLGQEFPVCRTHWATSGLREGSGASGGSLAPVM